MRPRQLIAELGVEQASLARIGQSAGASSGLASHHFGSKDALVARLARQSQDRVVEATGVRWSDARRPAEKPSALDCPPHHARAPIWSCSSIRRPTNAR